MGPQQPMSGWWPLSLCITFVILWIVAGALMGTWASCLYDCSNTLYYLGLGVIGLAVVAKIAFAIVLFIYMRRRKYRLYPVPNVLTPWSANASLLGPNRPYQPPPPSSHYDSYAYNPHHPTPLPASDAHAVGKEPLRYSTQQPVGKEPLRYATPQPQRPNAQPVRYCVQCSAPVNSPFCAHCGWSNPQ